jgi:hypothetical protein
MVDKGAGLPSGAVSNWLLPPLSFIKELTVKGEHTIIMEILMKSEERTNTLLL